MMIKIFLIVLLVQVSLTGRVINIDNIIYDAKSTQKHLFVWLHKTDCGYCENMREFTLENEKVEAFVSKNFIFIQINVYEKDSIKYKEFRGNASEFAKEIGYDFYPTSIFFDYEGEIIFSEVGFIDSDKEPNETRFYKILNYINSRSYEKIDYEDYRFNFEEEF